MRPRLAVVTAATLAALVAGAAGARAAEVSARLLPPAIALGDRAQLTVTVTGSRAAGTPEVPPVDGLDVQNVGQTTSMQIVNGSVTASVSHTFLVRPRRTGVFTIPPIAVDVDGQTLHTEPVTLRVQAAAAPAPGPQGRVRERGSAVGKPRLHIVLPARDLWVGELVPGELRLVVPGDVRATSVTPPVVQGEAFTINLKSSKEPKQSHTTVGGAPALLLTWPIAVAPVLPGEHPLSAHVTLDAVEPEPARRRHDPFGDPFDDPFFDSFFGGMFGSRGREVQLDAEAPERKIQVLALPETGRPADFSGAIGRFSIAATAKPTRVHVGDPVTFAVSVTGEGNFDRVSLPPLESGGGWKAYGANATYDAADEVGFTGKKVFEQAIVPQRSDVTAAPARRFSYFDPEARRYVTVSTQPVPVEVLPAVAGAGAPAPALPPAATATAAPARPAAADFELAPNHVVLGTLRRPGPPVLLQPWFLLLQVPPFAAVAFGWWWARRRARYAQDPARTRAARAAGEIRRQREVMARAAAAGDAIAFFLAARRALQERLATRLDERDGVDPARRAATLTLADVESILPNGSDASRTVREVFATADALAYARETPKDDGLDAWRTRLASTLRELEEGA